MRAVRRRTRRRDHGRWSVRLVGAAVALVALAAPATAAANWSQPGGGSLIASTSPGGCCPSIASIGGAPYIASLGVDGSSRRIFVKRLDGDSWSQVGGVPNHDTTKNVNGAPSIANIGGVPYLAWVESNGSHAELWVKKFDGSSWVSVGSNSVSLNKDPMHDAVSPYLAGIGGVPYVAWVESDGSGNELLWVKKFDGTAWDFVPSSPTSLNVSATDSASNPTMADFGGVPWVTWVEPVGGHLLVQVRRFDAGTNSWVSPNDFAINNSTMHDAGQPSIANVGGVPYLAWVESDGSHDQLYVKRYSGEWVATGGGGSLNLNSAFSAGGPTLVSVGGAPLVGWTEGTATVSQVRVRRFDGTSWRLVGDSLNVDTTKSASFTDPEIADVAGVPYAAWEEDDGVHFQVRSKRLEPDIVSESATPSTTGATLTAQINDYGVPLPVGFEYGTTGAFGTQTALQSSSGAGVSTLTQQIGGLTPATSYAYRAFGSDTFRETSQGATQAFTTLALPLLPLAPVDRISDFKLTPSTIIAASKGPPVTAARTRQKPGAIISYVGTEPATTTFTVQRPASGRVQGHSCVKPTRRNRRRRRCTRYVNVGSFTHVDVAGTNRFRFTGRIRGRKLRPGRYRLQAIPRNGAGAGPAAYRFFRVKARR